MSQHSLALQRFLKFLVVGGIGFGLNAVLLKLLSDAYHWNHAVANLTGATAAIFSNFNLNNHWTFQKERIRGAVAYIRGLVQFYAMSAFGVIVLQTGVILLGDRFIGEGNVQVGRWSMRAYLVYFVVGTCLLVIWNFTLYSRFIWRTASRTALSR